VWVLSRERASALRLLPRAQLTLTLGLMTQPGCAKLISIAKVVVVLAGLTACSDAAAPVVEPPPPPPLPGVEVLSLETYDGSGQAVHPDAAETPVSWGGGAGGQQLFITPYPNGDASKENPSLFTGASLLRWFVPSGVMNPIARPGTGYLSDPDQVFNPETNELWLYYRSVTTENEIFLIRGIGPARWSVPTLVARAPNHTIVSPTLVRRGAGDWLMWSVNSGASGCTSSSTTVELRTSTDGITWSSPLITDLAEPEVSPWHIDVEWIPARQEFWAIYNVKVAGSCTTAALHFATSADGVHWTLAASPVLQRAAIPEFTDIVYRASLEYDQASDAITLWYSGARFADGRYTWKIATEQLSAADFFARIFRLPLPGSGLGVTTSPPLTNDDAP
jgi:hypothetical protein